MSKRHVALLHSRPTANQDTKPDKFHADRRSGAASNSPVEASRTRACCRAPGLSCLGESGCRAAGSSMLAADIMRMTNVMRSTSNVPPLVLHAWNGHGLSRGLSKGREVSWPVS